MGVSFPDLLQFRVDGETRFDFEVQGSVILEVDGDGVIIGRGVEVDPLDGFAVDLWEVDKPSAGEFLFHESKGAGCDFVTAAGRESSLWDPSLRIPRGETQGRSASIRVTIGGPTIIASGSFS